MSKLISVGSCTFCFPEQGQKSGWGEVVTDTICALATTLATVSGANDISLKTINIANNTCSATDIGSGACALSFAIGAVRSFETTYSVLRTDCCCANTVETGIMTGIYNGSAWAFSVEHIGCAGVCFTITCAGQVQYTSDATKGAGTIKFKASTIAQ